MKSLYLTISVLLFYINGFTQSFNMPVKHTTPRGSFTTYERVGIPMHYYNYNTIVNGKYKFTIVFLNDSTIEKKVKININDSIHQLSWKTDDSKIIITPKDTKEIFRLDETGKKIKGIPMDSCWAFLAEVKKIRTYSITSDILYPTIAYIQKDEHSPLLPLTKENLELIVQDNKKALSLARKGKLLRAIRKYNQNS